MPGFSIVEPMTFLSSLQLSVSREVLFLGSEPLMIASLSKENGNHCSNLRLLSWLQALRKLEGCWQGGGKKKLIFFFPGGVCYCCLDFTAWDKDYWSLFSEVCNNSRNGRGPGADIFMLYKPTLSISTAFEQNTVVCERKKLEYGEEASPPEPIVMPSRKKSHYCCCNYEFHHYSRQTFLLHEL